MDIELLHPVMQRMYDKLLQEMGGGWKGYSGLRTFQEQNKLYAQGRSAPGKIVTYAQGGESAHNFGIAVDLADFSLKDPWCADWDKLGAACARLKLKWGGHFKKPVDKPHVQLDLPDSPIEDLKSMYERYGKEKCDFLITLASDENYGEKP